MSCWVARGIVALVGMRGTSWVIKIDCINKEFGEKVINALVISTIWNGITREGCDHLGQDAVLRAARADRYDLLAKQRSFGTGLLRQAARRAG